MMKRSCNLLLRMRKWRKRGSGAKKHLHKRSAEAVFLTELACKFPAGSHFLVKILIQIVNSGALYRQTLLVVGKECVESCDVFC